MICHCPVCKKDFHLSLKRDITEQEWRDLYYPGLAADQSPRLICFLCFKEDVNRNSILPDPEPEVFDPFKDEKKAYSMEEWVQVAKNSLDYYKKDWSPPNRTNEFHSAKHSWNEWWDAFFGYMSW